MRVGPRHRKAAQHVASCRAASPLVVRVRLDASRTQPLWPAQRMPSVPDYWGLDRPAVTAQVHDRPTILTILPDLVDQRRAWKHIRFPVCYAFSRPRRPGARSN